MGTQRGCLMLSRRRRISAKMRSFTPFRVTRIGLFVALKAVPPARELRSFRRLLQYPLCERNVSVNPCYAHTQFAGNSLPSAKV